VAGVTGPISSLPGSIYPVPPGMECDNHPGIPAVKRVQGKTDSLGSEMNDYCEACYEQVKTAIKPDKSGSCDWCKLDRDDLRPVPDYEEASARPVYYLCAQCRAKRAAELRQRDEELRWLSRNHSALGKSAMRQGATAYIRKPFQMGAVMARFVRTRRMKRLEAEPAEYHQNLENIGSIPFSAKLSAIAGPELGMFPAMTVDKEGIFITREDDGYTVPTYVFKPPSEWPKEQVMEFADRVLKVRPLSGTWLIGAGFKRCYGGPSRRVADLAETRTLVPEAVKMLVDRSEAPSLPDIITALASTNIPEKHIANLASFLDSHRYPGMWTVEVLLENGFELRGASKTEATFVDGEGIRVIFTKDKWRMVWPTGKSFEHTSVSLLGEAVDPWLRQR